jgi:hypothetical protein
VSNLDYKEGRGDYYLAEGLREERRGSVNITKRELVRALRETGIAPIGMSYDTAAGQIWEALWRRRA